MCRYSCLQNKFMSNLVIDSEKLEVGDIYSIFLIAGDLESLAKECEKTPLHPKEKLIEKEGSCFRRALILGASDPKHNGIIFVAWDSEKNARAIAYQKTHPTVNDIYRVNTTFRNLK